MIRRLLLAAVVLALVVPACGLPGQVDGPVKVTATFDDVGDLVAGHSVQVADVRVGSITGIELTEDFEAKVTMSLKSNVDIPKSSQALLRTTSLLGEKFIELRATDDPTKGPFLVNGDVITDVAQAPELEFVAEEVVNLLGGVVAADVQTLVRTGSEAFKGREAELTGIIENLAIISNTLADQTDDIVTIIDGLDVATDDLADGAPALDDFLVNLEETVDVLADNRQEALDAVEQLTRLAQVQNEEVFEPFLADVDRQIKQLDAILAELNASRDEVGLLLQWLAQFVEKVPSAVPNEFAQVYGLLVLAPGEGP